MKRIVLVSLLGFIFFFVSMSLINPNLQAETLDNVSEFQYNVHPDLLTGPGRNGKIEFDDLDGDGDLDLIVRFENTTEGQYYTYAYTNVNGVFSATPIPIIASLDRINNRDLNYDGKPDFITIDPSTFDVSVAYFNGSYDNLSYELKTIDVRHPDEILEPKRFTNVSDIDILGFDTFDADGNSMGKDYKYAILGSDANATSYLYYYNSLTRAQLNYDFEPGQFGYQRTFQTNHHLVETTEFNQDGRFDFVTLGNLNPFDPNPQSLVHVYLSFEEMFIVDYNKVDIFFTNFNPLDLKIEDINNDNTDDIIVFGHNKDTNQFEVKIFEYNLSDDSFDLTHTMAVNGVDMDGNFNFKIADVNNDGLLDLVNVATGNLDAMNFSDRTTSINIQLNLGNNNFESIDIDVTSDLGSTFLPSSLAFNDADDDGDLDIYLAGSTLSDGLMSNTAIHLVEIEFPVPSISYNLDGGTGNSNIVLNNSFTSTTLSEASSGGIFVEDMNLDGIDDVITLPENEKLIFIGKVNADRYVDYVTINTVTNQGKAYVFNPELSTTNSFHFDTITEFKSIQIVSRSIENEFYTQIGADAVMLTADDFSKPLYTTTGSLLNRPLSISITYLNALGDNKQFSFKETFDMETNTNPMGYEISNFPSISNTIDAISPGNEVINEGPNYESMKAMLTARLDSDLSEDLVGVLETYTIIKYIGSMPEQEGYLIPDTSDLDYTKIQDVIVTDFNQDGFNDIVYLLNDNTLYVLEHNGEANRDNIAFTSNTYTLNVSGTVTQLLEINLNNDTVKDYLFITDQNELYALDGIITFVNDVRTKTLDSPRFLFSFDKDILAIHTATLDADSLEDLVVEFVDGSHQQFTNKPNVISRNEDPVKPGYVFDDYYLFDETKTRDQYLDADKFDFSTSVTTDAVIIALYDVIDYDITYNLDGGNNDVNNPSSYNIEDEDITLEPATKDSFTFKGWFDNPEFTGDPITVIDNETLQAVTLYASFELAMFDVTYVLDGGDNDPSNLPQFLIAEGLTLADASKTGYTFEGWFTDAAFTNEVTEIAIGTSEDVTLYAQFEIIDYNITYELDNGNNDVNNPDTYTVLDTITLEDASKTGYTFEGWFTDDSFTNEVTTIDLGTTDDITLYAKFETINYTITYELEGGTNDSNNPLTFTVEEEITLEDASKIGYTFEGWYTDDAFTNRVTSISLGTSENVTLYADFDIIDYGITYNLNNGDNDTDNPIIYNVESDTIILEAPTREGYSFNGWTNADETISYLFILSGSIGDVDLYAQWTINTYIVTLIPEGVFNSNFSNLTQTVEHGSSLIDVSDPTLNGYEFKYWTDGESTYSTTQLLDLSITAPITFVAVFEADEVDPETQTYVVFYVDDGFVTSEEVSEGGTLQNVPTPQTPSGFTFVEWVLGGSSVDVTSMTVTQDTVLIAVYEADEEEPVEPETPIEATRDTDNDGYTFTEGTATLNGNPYVSGTAITEPGDYTLEITDGTRVTEVTFTIASDGTTPQTPIEATRDTDKAQQP